MTGTAPASWPGVRVYYHDAADDLILDAVRPALTAARADVPGAFFVRHWHGGPQVGLCFPGPDDAFGRVGPSTVQALREWLAAHPSAGPVDEAQLRREQEILSAREGVRAPTGPPAPDNSVELAGYDRRLEELGGAEAAGVVEDFYASTNPAVYGVLEAVRGGGSRTAAALDLLWAVVHTHGAAVVHPFVSLRTHAEVFLADAAEPDGCREQFETQFAARRRALARRLDGLLTSGGWPADVAVVLATLDRLRPRVIRLTDAGLVNLWGRAGDVPPPPPRGRTDFLDRLESGRLPGKLAASAPFAVWRVVVNLLYLHLTRLGITPFQRALLAYLAAAALEERLGVTATDVIW